MNSPMLYWQIILSCESFMTDRMRLDGIMLQHPAVWKAMVSVHSQTCTFENHTNLLPYLANWLLYTLENGFLGFIERQGGPFLGFAQALSASIVRMNLPEQAPTHGNVYCWLHNYVHGCTSTMCLCSIKPSLPFLYPLCLSYYATHMINYSRPYTAFLYCKQ